MLSQSKMETNAELQTSPSKRGTKNEKELSIKGKPLPDVYITSQKVMKNKGSSAKKRKPDNLVIILDSTTSLSSSSTSSEDMFLHGIHKKGKKCKLPTISIDDSLQFPTFKNTPVILSRTSSSVSNSSYSDALKASPIKKTNLYARDSESGSNILTETRVEPIITKTNKIDKRVTRSISKTSRDSLNSRPTVISPDNVQTINKQIVAAKIDKRVTRSISRASVDSNANLISQIPDKRIIRKSSRMSRDSELNTITEETKKKVTAAKINKRIAQPINRESRDSTNSNIEFAANRRITRSITRESRDSINSNTSLFSNIPERRVTRNVTSLDSEISAISNSVNTEEQKVPAKIKKNLRQIDSTTDRCVTRSNSRASRDSEIIQANKKQENTRSRASKQITLENSFDCLEIENETIVENYQPKIIKPNKPNNKKRPSNSNNKTNVVPKKQKINNTTQIDNNIINLNAGPHKVVPNAGGGNCLFYTLSYLMHSNDNHAMRIRQEVVQYVAAHFEDFQIQTYNHQENGNNFTNPDDYVQAMEKSTEFAGTCELNAASKLYDFQFVIYRNCEEIAKFGEVGKPIKRFRITGPIDNGHFEAYESLSTTENLLSLQTQNEIEIPDTNNLCDLFQPEMDEGPAFPIDAKLGPTEQFVSVAQGTKHQGVEFYPDTNNMSCVVMAITALCCKYANFEFDTDLIDFILNEGNNAYLNIVQNIPRLLDPEEIRNNSEILLNDIRFKISTPYWVENGLYPSGLDENSLFDTVKRLHKILTVHNEADGFLFIGCNSAVSFWPESKINHQNSELKDKNLLFNFDGYYVFNSHAIDESSEYSPDENLNKARLFKVQNLNSLALLLVYFNHINRGEDSQYSIYAVKIKTFEEAISFSNDTTSITSSTKSKGGRPRAKKRGRPKKKENAHLDAVRKYNNNHREKIRKAVAEYTKKHPEVNRKAVTTYNETHPGISLQTSQTYRSRNIDAVQQYYSNYNLKRNVHPELQNLTAPAPIAPTPIAPTPTRQSNLICELTGENLNKVPFYELKKADLNDENIHICNYCSSRLFEEEKTSVQWCCGLGRFNILTLPELTESFYCNATLLKRIRAYNNIFAFSAIGVSHGYQHPRDGIAFLKIQGRIYHRVFDLSYNDSPNPISRYIDDGEERRRHAQHEGLNETLVNEISTFLERVNPFINEFRRLSLEEHEDAHLVFQKTNRAEHGNVLGDMPTGSEVAAIMSTTKDTFYPKSIALWKIGESRPHTVDIFHPLYEAFQYPLLYPQGGAGWTTGTMDNKGKKLSQTKYVRFLLLSHKRFFTLGRLSEEWLVDMYCRIEEERLRFIANQQKRGLNSATNTRVAPADELENNIAAAVLNDETVDGDGGPVAGKIYLPNTFTGGPRYMKVKYMDAIAIVNRLGGPSYFLTMTCNPKWPEILKNTPPHLNAPATICARVFKLRLQRLMNDIKSGLWFGKKVYLLHVIEFQKRGLPHAHIVFRVENAPTQNIEIDKVIRADIPSVDECDGRLRALVLKHMVHGPCGEGYRTDLPCWNSDKKKCMKYYPKPENSVTYIDNKGFVHLKRNAENQATITYRGRNVPVSDLYIVPYNPVLLLSHDCHINLEVASTRKVFKYLFKYITKGPDEARVAVRPTDKNDEVESYVTARYISASEASYRILEYDIQSRTPNVTQLPIHLENKQTVFFKPGTEVNAYSTSCSKLMIYFQRPPGEEFDTLTYQQFFEQYMYKANTKKNRQQREETIEEEQENQTGEQPVVQPVKKVPIYEIMDGRYSVFKRQRNELVARLFWVAPNRGEQFYLRLLLAAFPCRSYDDLRALGGPDCTTFQEAAQAKGIADDENEYALAIEEAATFYTGKKMRHFFVMLICNGARASILWDKYKRVISEDYLERLNNDETLAFNQSLLEIDRLLRKQGSSLEDHGLPRVNDDSTEFSRELYHYDHDRMNSFCAEWLPQLSPEQRQVFDYTIDLITNAHNNDNPNAIFLDGPSGTGKTLLLNCIVSHVRGELRRVAICTASSGIAALNYEGGCTAHSMFKYPFEILDDTGVWCLTNGTERAELIFNSALIIYDEAPMAHKYLIHLLDRSLRDLMNNTKLFGGKVVILAGDFRQIPPVVRNATNNNDILNASFKTSPLYMNMKKFALTSAQRTRTDESYSEFLLNLGSGLLTPRLIPGVDIQLTPTSGLTKLANVEYVTEMKDLIEFVFPTEDLNNPDVCAKKAILSTHLNNVHEINALILSKLDGEAAHCYSVDRVDEDQAGQFFLGTDILNAVREKGVPDYELTFKVGAVAIIIRNLSFNDGLVNGTKVIIMSISPRLIGVRKPNDQEIFHIPRITFKFPIEAKSIIEMTRQQFPLQLANAMTIHKSQGQTIERVGVDLRSDIFSHGQLYVALGRVRSRDSIKILVPRSRIKHNEAYSNNVIITELIN